MSEAYDNAERICSILMLYKKRICTEDIIIYPSDWIGSSSFEISIRSKKNFDSAIEVDIDTLFGIIEKYGAKPSNETYCLEANGMVITPLKIRFNSFEYE